MDDAVIEKYMDLGGGNLRESINGANYEWGEKEMGTSGERIERLD
jgi:hypothetical protein